MVETVIIFVILVVLVVMIVIMGVRVFDTIQEIQKAQQEEITGNKKDHERIDTNVDTVLNAQKSAKRSLTNDIFQVRRDLTDYKSSIGTTLQKLNNTQIAFSNDVTQMRGDLDMRIGNVLDYTTRLDKSLVHAEDVMEEGFETIHTSMTERDAYWKSEYATVESSVKTISDQLRGTSSNVNTLLGFMGTTEEEMQMLFGQTAALGSNVAIHEERLNIVQPTVTKIVSGLSNIASGTLLGITSTESEFATLSNVINGISDRLTGIDRRVGSFSNSIVTRQLTMADYVFDTTSKGELSISAPFKPNTDMLLLNNAKVNKAVTVMPGGMLNFSLIKDTPTTTVQPSNPDTNYIIDVDSTRNAMNIRMPSNSGLMLSRGNQEQVHTFNASGVATHLGGIVTPSVQIGEYQIVKEGSNLVVKNTVNGEMLQLLPKPGASSVIQETTTV